MLLFALLFKIMVVLLVPVKQGNRGGPVVI